MDTSRGKHARRQKSHMPVAAIGVAIIADLVSSCALEDVVRVVGIADLALSLPISTRANEIMTQGDVYQQIGLPRHVDVADFEIGPTVALAREHPLVNGGETSVITNALQRPQYMVMCACPIRGMVEAGVDVVPGTFTTHEIPLTGTWHVRKRSEGRVVGESEELMKEGDIVILRDCFRGALRSSATCRPCTDQMAPH